MSSLAQTQIDGGINAPAGSAFGATVSIAGQATFTAGTAATSTTTGSAVVTGGAGISGALWVGDVLNVAGIATFAASTASSSTTTGAAVVTGGLGVGGAAYVGGVLHVAGVGSFTSGTASSSTTTGALVVTGGLGLSGALYGASAVFSSTVGVTNTLSLTGSGPSLQYTVGSTLSFYLSASATQFYITDHLASTNPLTYTTGSISAGNWVFANTTTSTSTSTGAVIINGGLGVGGAIYGTTLSLSSTLGVTGVLTGTSGTFSSTLAATNLITITGSGPALLWTVGSTQSFELSAASTQFYLTDKIASTNPLTYNTGAIGAGNWLFANTTASTNSSSGSVVLLGGMGIAGALFGTSATFTSSAGVTITGSSSNGILQLNGTSGNGGAIKLGTGGTYGCSLTGLSTGALTFADLINTTSPLVYTPGAIGAGYITFNNTLTAAAYNSASVVFAGGVGIAGPLITNSTLTISSAQLIHTNTSFTNNAAAAVATLTNAPTAGNPTKWIPINDAGTLRNIPAW